MLPLVAVICVSLAFYLFYKIKSARTRLPMEKKWLKGKSSIALGVFVATYGINQLILFQTTTTFIIGAIFIVIGGLSIWGGFKVYKHFLPLAIEEAKHKMTSH
ncbi:MULTISPECIES: YtpI family protein [Bacillaceae]|uniref:Amino acid transporter n=1 Tax=Peribacillus huizhouensis TaxID=1501239 RepID=A0ABR6CMD6_9BACI|nr:MULTISPECIES: YtpI family protein [Bacillaceae]MBA9025881.1 amino acid transporter [Peribacillus huizhouensis]